MSHFGATHSLPRPWFCSDVALLAYGIFLFLRHCFVQCVAYGFILMHCCNYCRYFINEKIYFLTIFGNQLTKLSSASLLCLVIGDWPNKVKNIYMFIYKICFCIIDAHVRTLLCMARYLPNTKESMYNDALNINYTVPE